MYHIYRFSLSLSKRKKGLQLLSQVHKLDLIRTVHQN
ncbi:hypothetical protein AWRI1631_163400 [Saccharomyces cerevisiae AWRI1631]|uniref:Uncharacterized protein n=1 Tax=Saccharomyces cerevisiae (strain AWRI1631) TaxID=545124 RepID=B5VTM8_YEAS6|nr:hypothetical protein AWRI1631_163400 [Saccharomyces cerevisiae AWRI1631]